MDKKRFPDWVRDFIIVFLLFVAFDSVRNLLAAGLPVVGTVIEGAGAAMMFCLLSPVWDTFSRRNNEK